MPPWMTRSPYSRISVGLTVFESSVNSRMSSGFTSSGARANRMIAHEGVLDAFMGDHAVGARELFARLVEFIRHGVSSDCSRGQPIPWNRLVPRVLTHVHGAYETIS